MYKLDKNYKTQVYIPVWIIFQGVWKVGPTDRHYRMAWKQQNTSKNEETKNKTKSSFSYTKYL